MSFVSRLFNAQYRYAVFILLTRYILKANDLDRGLDNFVSFSAPAAFCSTHTRSDDQILRGHA